MSFAVRTKRCITATFKVQTMSSRTLFVYLSRKIWQNIIGNIIRRWCVFLWNIENWFSSRNDDVEGRKYYVRSSFDQIHNKATIYILLLLLLYTSQMKQQYGKKYRITQPRQRRTSPKYGSPVSPQSPYIIVYIYISVHLYIILSFSAHCTVEIRKIGE